MTKAQELITLIEKMSPDKNVSDDEIAALSSDEIRELLKGARRDGEHVDFYKRCAQELIKRGEWPTKLGYFNDL